MPVLPGRFVFVLLHTCTIKGTLSGPYQLPASNESNVWLHYAQLRIFFIRVNYRQPVQVCERNLGNVEIKRLRLLDMARWIVS